ncbi:YjbH domain-containing protein [Vibrio breoganii]|uniref:YjbH domain-containing protein n=1 Tax=Vibrio breoganii TaxID=553239 RepID=UPI0021C415AF|nr:YjbH domain-containing protein [Vibrio breoganii]MDN3715378.1 YjbH domain-containing protein [Vibrio breoganii]
MRTTASRTLALSLVTGFSYPALAQVDILPSQQGFSGLIFTPNAQTIETGRGSALFSQGVPYRGSIAELDNWYVNAGVFPHLEVGGRIVTQTYDCNGYTESGCGIRDLSATAKFQLPYLEDLTGFNLAFGAQDIGGAASNFDAYFVVADTEIESFNLRLSGGYGQSDLSLGVLDGPFAGAEWQPFDFVQLAGEYDAQEFNAAVRLMTPRDMLPYGAQLAAQYQLYSGHENQDQTLWGVSASVPFFGDTFTRNKYSDVKPDSQTQVETQLAKGDASSLTQLIGKLEQEGFVNIRVGANLDTLVIALESKRYQHNTMDGAGVALGIISANSGEGLFADLPRGSSKAQKVELVLLQNKVPMLSINTELNCYRDFLKSGAECEQMRFSNQDLAAKLDQTQWRYETVNDGFGYSELIFSPVMNYAVATEYGFFDYSIGLGTNLYTPLWKGAAVDVRHILPIANSDDYDDGYYESDALENEVDRALVHQAFRLPANTMTLFSAGLIRSDYYGGQNETQWYSTSGMHNLGFEAGYFTAKDSIDTEDRTPLLAHYRLSVAQWNWQMQVQGGEFWGGDQGVKATSSHWLGDTRLDASYLNSESEQFVTLNVSIPLTFWRGMKPDYLTVRGVSEWNFSVQTRVGESHNQLNTGLGKTANNYHNLDRQYFNRARLNPNYFENNPIRLRNAYLRYLDEVVYE